MQSSEIRHPNGLGKMDDASVAVRISPPDSAALDYELRVLLMRPEDGRFFNVLRRNASHWRCDDSVRKKDGKNQRSAARCAKGRKRFSKGLPPALVRGGRVRLRT